MFPLNQDPQKQRTSRELVSHSHLLQNLQASSVLSLSSPSFQKAGRGEHRDLYRQSFLRKRHQEFTGKPPSNFCIEDSESEKSVAISVKSRAIDAKNDSNISKKQSKSVTGSANGLVDQQSGTQE